MARILLIDDAEDARAIFSSAMETHSTHEVLAVESWSQGMPLMLEQSFDLVLVDVNMPDLSGERVAELAARASDGATSIVLFSALDTDELSRRAAAVGATGSISKNFRAAELIRQVERFL